MALFSKYNRTESMLLDVYANKLQMVHGITSPGFSQVFAKSFLDETIKDSKNNGTYDLPSNLGDIILNPAKNIKFPLGLVDRIIGEVRATLPAKRKEGVRDEDIKFWWNMLDVERRITIRYDKYLLVEMTEKYVKLGEKNEDAISKIRKEILIYVESTDMFSLVTADHYAGKGEDSALPYELSFRIAKWTHGPAPVDPDKFKKELEQSSSFNAFIRKNIRAGNL